jgi:FlaG/FlaF family flagellin (archaellin)
MGLYTCVGFQYIVYLYICLEYVGGDLMSALKVWPLRFLRCRRGVSTIIATLLMIVVAVAAAVIVYLWATGFIGGATSTSSGPQDQIAIDSAAFTSGSVSLYVHNTGSAAVKVTNIYVDGVQVPGGNYTLNDPTSTPVTIDMGATKTFTFNHNWVSGTTYTFKVVTQAGGSASVNFKAP